MQQPLYYSGLECYANQIVPLNLSKHLIFPFQFIQHSSGEPHQCVLWKRGQFTEPTQIRSSQSIFNNQQEQITTYSTNYTFFNERWVKTDKASQRDSIPWMASNQFRNHISGASLYFVGDSMIRQIFCRIVSHIRGYSFLTERIFHRNAIYSFNSSQDLFSIGEKELVRNSLFTAEFIWNPKLAVNHHAHENCNNVNNVKRKKRSTVTVCIVGLFYWELDECGWEKLKPFQSNRTLFVTVPPKKIKPNMSEHCECRNTWIRDHSNNGGGLYLPLAEMARTETFQRTVQDNGLHFQCSFQGLLQDGSFYYSSGTNKQLQVKAPANKDCRDMVNLNLAMLIAHFWEQHRGS